MTPPVGMRQFHASCAARQGVAVLLFGPPGSGKSDLLLRLLARGYDLVADDRVEMEGRTVRAPAALRGLIEVRGWGIVRRSFLPEACAVLSVGLVARGDLVARLPGSTSADTGPSADGPVDPFTGLPFLQLCPHTCSAPERIDVALDCVEGRAFRLPQDAMLRADDCSR